MNPANMNPANINPQAALELRDIHLPLSPEQWPPAPGWWLLFFAALIFLGWISFSLFKYWRRYRLQKEILVSLHVLEIECGEEKPSEFLAEISILLRRVAMMNFPSQQVAALTGKGWLSFLDLHGGGGEYTNGVGRVLADGPYTTDESNVDRQALLLLTKKWIKRNAR